MTLVDKEHAQRSEEELLAITKAFRAAWNARDLEAIMAFFTDDVVFAIGPAPLPPGSEIATGKRQVRSNIRLQLSGFHVETWDYRVSGNRVSWRFEYSNDFFRNQGVDSLEGTHEAAIEGDKIKLWIVTFSPETRKKLEVALIQHP